MTTAALNRSLGAQSVQRPNTVAVGTIVWLGSEVMFFAGLFAIYFTLKSTSPGLWAEQTEKLNVPFATTITIILVLSSVTCQFGVFARSSGRTTLHGGRVRTNRRDQFRADIKP